MSPPALSMACCRDFPAEASTFFTSSCYGVGFIRSRIHAVNGVTHRAAELIDLSLSLALGLAGHSFENDVDRAGGDTSDAGRAGGAAGRRKEGADGAFQAIEEIVDRAVGSGRAGQKQDHRGKERADAIRRRRNAIPSPQGSATGILFAAPQLHRALTSFVLIALHGRHLFQRFFVSLALRILLVLVALRLHIPAHGAGGALTLSATLTTPLPPADPRSAAVLSTGAAADTPSDAPSSDKAAKSVCRHSSLKTFHALVMALSSHAQKFSETVFAGAVFFAILPPTPRSSHLY